MATAKLLIVDDNAIVRQMIACLARELGMSVIEAASVDAARAWLASGDVDVLLCDGDLGAGLSGVEFIVSDTMQMPATIVLMSGNPKPNGLQEGIRYLCKPFTIRQLEIELLP
ncbi:response regulator [Sphingomonas sp. PAMC 26617]|uniref:response regulator n=1 Tax=Sphingomonas sp. PAMC 26617 TaxID=1112216 RepID=UPI0009D98058|nr:response regulator [Sphingomonas sp. PAMC 26617]